jgi:hypothetical protein
MRRNLRLPWLSSLDYLHSLLAAAAAAIEEEQLVEVAVCVALTILPPLIVLAGWRAFLFFIESFTASCRAFFFSCFVAYNGSGYFRRGRRRFCVWYLLG